MQKKYVELYGVPDHTKRPIRMWVSPFNRTRETAQFMLKSDLNKWVTDVREDDTLVELDWGMNRYRP